MGAPHSPRSHPSEGPAAALLDPSFPCKTRRLLRTRPMPAKSTNYPLSVNGFAKLLREEHHGLRQHRRCDTSKSRRAATKHESSPVSAPPLASHGHRATLLLPTKNPRRERCANGKQHGQCRYVAHVAGPGVAVPDSLE